MTVVAVVFLVVELVFIDEVEDLVEILADVEETVLATLVYLLLVEDLAEVL